MGTRTGDDHGLRLPADLVGGLGEEMVEHDLGLALDGVRMPPHMLHEQPPSLGRFNLVARRRLLVLQQLEIGAVGRVVLHHIEDEAFLDGLAHGVAMEGFVFHLLHALHRHHLARLTEDFQRLGLRRRREGKERQMRQPLAPFHDEGQFLGHRVVPLGVLVVLGNDLLQGFRRGQHQLQILRALAALRAVGLIDDQRELLALQPLRAAQRRAHPAEFLQGADDDLGAAGQGFDELPGVPVDLLHQAGGLLELLDRVLQLFVQHLPVGDDDDAVEHQLAVLALGIGEQIGQLVRQPGDGVRLA